MRPWIVVVCARGCGKSRQEEPQPPPAKPVEAPAPVVDAAPTKHTVLFDLSQRASDAVLQRVPVVQALSKIDSPAAGALAGATAMRLPVDTKGESYILEGGLGSISSAPRRRKGGCSRSCYVTWSLPTQALPMLHSNASPKTSAAR